MWVCILCRKKQELLSKSGEWIMKGTMDGATLRRMQEDMQASQGMMGLGGGGLLLADQGLDKRPKLERAHSAAEKENVPLLQRSSSLLKRQYSHQEQIPSRRLSMSADSGVEMSVSPHSRSLPQPGHVSAYNQSIQPTPRHPAAYPEDDPSLYRGELDGLMKQQQNSSVYQQRQRQLYQNSDAGYGPQVHDATQSPSMTMRGLPRVQPHQLPAPPLGPQSHLPMSQHHLHNQLHPGHPAVGPGQRSFSSSEEERSTPECASDEHDDREHHGRKSMDARGERMTPSDMSHERIKMFLAHPVLPWQVSSDGQKLIGHMVLRKQGGAQSSSNILGLKVVGGKLLEDGSMGAFIEKVKKDSPADLEGQLKIGDEVLQWNGRSLKGKSYEEVSDVIAMSRTDPQVELVVARDYLPGKTDDPSMASAKALHHHQQQQQQVVMPGSPAASLNTRRYAAQNQWRQKQQLDAQLTPQMHHKGKISSNITIRENSKRRTKTVANTNEPRWDQTFVYNGIRWSELRQRSLEITVWDYDLRFGANDFLGEIVISLAVSSLNDELEWHYLVAHDEHRQPGRYYQETTEDVVTTPGDCHLSPPSTTSRLSDSDTSECDITDCDGSREHRRTADGASISSIGSSSRFHNMPPNYKRHYSSPPPEKELCVGEHRSRRDMSPQGRKRAALMSSREQAASLSGYQQYRKVNFRQFSDESHRGAGMLSHRSHSAAPMDSPSLCYRGRSQSPTGHRSLSPPDHRSIPYSSGYAMPARFGSRSATATPTGSPKKRQLPQIPGNLHAALKERAIPDFDGTRFLRHRNHRPMHNYYGGRGMGMYDRRVSGMSDSDLTSMSHYYDTHSNSYGGHHPHRFGNHHRSRRGHLSPEKDVLADLGDSDMESIASVTSSAFSTQSERPRGSRGMIDYAMMQGGSYEKPSRYHHHHHRQHAAAAASSGELLLHDDDRLLAPASSSSTTLDHYPGESRQSRSRNGSLAKRGQFARSFSNADAPTDDKADRVAGSSRKKKYEGRVNV
ncbi:regulating synaptic membrane exocytosis protein 2-like [Copidosoma floridanum]|uniref:regulating synaptic membrane exocytosis protein 2-like n=1 Tax=Copidosoma floridanum TaxID=29053 RepID=UPI0006C9C040|nr:regulating synaptic membrane exocytosis protein 2-like [Copidosoma floridanum]